MKNSMSNLIIDKAYGIIINNGEVTIFSKETGNLVRISQLFKRYLLHRFGSCNIEIVWTTDCEYSYVSRIVNEHEDALATPRILLPSKAQYEKAYTLFKEMYEAENTAIEELCEKFVPAENTAISTKREEALTSRYGNKESRKSYVANVKSEALRYLDDNAFVYEVNNGKVTFAPTREQVNGISKAEFKAFREEFRKRFPYA